MLTLLSLLALAPSPPLCRVQATARPYGPYNTQRVLTVTVRPDCPPGGVAYVRLASLIGGSLPDSPPGRYIVRPGLPLRRVALPWWHVEWLSASGRAAYRVPETLLPPVPQEGQ